MTTIRLKCPNCDYWFECQCSDAAERELEALRGKLAEAMNEIQTHSWGWQGQEPCDTCTCLLARLAPTEPKENAHVH